MTYRNDMDALAARKDRLESELEAKTRELDTTGRLLEQAKAKAKLPVLPNIRVASPCPADWNAMTPVDGERVRACAQCNKNVYNLSQMTRDEAEALILAKEGRLCVRYFQRKDGTILLKDCEIGVARGRKRRLIAAGAAALLATGGAAAAAFMMRGDPAKPPVAENHDVIQGGIGPLDPDVHEMKGDIGPVQPMHDVEVMQGGMPAPGAFEQQAKKPHAKHQVSKKRTK
jgi:hypothetical protein